MEAYSAEGWGTFLSAAAGATATLTGLVFVGVSINLQRILASPLLADRALEALALLLAPLIASMLGLVPAQGSTLLGAELLVVGLAVWALTVTLQARAVPTLAPELRHQFVQRVCLGQAATLPVVLAGLTLLLHIGGGLYWLAPGLIFATLAGVADSWVLLVEILR